MGGKGEHGRGVLFLFLFLCSMVYCGCFFGSPRYIVLESIGESWFLFWFGK